jgi:hypothetical protein
MQRSIVEELVGDTLKVTFVNTGATVSPLVSTLLDPLENLVSSVTAIASGNGAYYALHILPGSPQWLVNRWWGVINANTYTRSQFVRVRTMETD